MSCSHLGVMVTQDNDGRSHYRCSACDAVLREYDRWYHKVWAVVRRDDVGERFVVPRWMGSIGELYDVKHNTATFAVIPLNAIVDLTLKAFRFLKYRLPGKLHHEIEMSYRRGRVDTAREANAEAHRRLREAHAAEVSHLETVVTEQQEQIAELKDKLKEKAG